MKIVNSRKTCKECKENRIGKPDCNNCSNKLHFKRVTKLLLILTAVIVLKVVTE